MERKWAYHWRERICQRLRRIDIVPMREIKRDNASSSHVENRREKIEEIGAGCDQRIDLWIKRPRIDAI